jgi:hypothetical protein
MKARNAQQAVRFTDIPNIGPAIAKDFTTIGLATPKDLKGKDAFVLYTKLCKKTGVRHDPCVLDTFLAAVDFMNGAAPKAWWAYTKERKRLYPHV